MLKWFVLKFLIFNSHPFVLVGRGKLDTSGVIIGLPDLALVTIVAVLLAVDGSKC